MDSPFILSAAPPTDGYDQMKKAYEAGWAGGIMKTAFDNLDIHIPAEYMFTWGDKNKTFANCDNVSDHPLDRVCEEIGRLIKEYPDKLTMASTGGPVTGDDVSDKAGWQANTRKLEKSGVMGIEYSLSCPQGGDGTHGDIVAQDAELTAKIIDWVMQISDPEIPKLFKLTGAVTAIYPIISAVKEGLDRYPGKKAGVTLANTFPTLGFRARKEGWDEGIIVGMSGEGALPISYLSLARAGKMGVFVSGNGGAMSYMDAANFLALGAGNVQFCTIVEKYGYGIIDELKLGLSHLLEAKGLKSVSELIGYAQPNPVTDFMELPKKSKSSSLIRELCVQCGNCTRCPYLAITLDEEGYPKIDTDKCVGCSLCVQLCFAGALEMKQDQIIIKT
jgi:dihydropyrimidine dehydrogenase (NAD+) subunit PreA